MAKPHIAKTMGTIMSTQNHSDTIKSDQESYHQNQKKEQKMIRNNGLGGMHKNHSYSLWTSNHRNHTPDNHHRHHQNHRCVKFPTRCLRYTEDFAVLGVTPFATKSDVKHAYKRLALKYHPDVARGENIHEKQEIFRDIKSAYESLMHKFEADEVEEEIQPINGNNEEEFEEWDQWMGFEGGMPVVYNPS